MVAVLGSLVCALLQAARSLQGRSPTFVLHPLLPHWLALVGSFCPVVAALAVLQESAVSGKRSQVNARLHTALVLAAVLAVVVLLRPLGWGLMSPGSTPAAPWVWASITASVPCALLAGQGANAYLPFDLPTALRMWLFPRGGARWWHRSTPPERALSVLIPAALIEVGILLLCVDPGFPAYDSLSALPLRTIDGLRAAMSLMAIFSVALLQDVGRRQRLSPSSSTARTRSFAPLLAGLAAYTSFLWLAAGAAYFSQPHCGFRFGGRGLFYSAALWFFASSLGFAVLPRRKRVSAVCLPMA